MLSVTYHERDVAFEAPKKVVFYKAKYKRSPVLKGGHRGHELPVDRIVKKNKAPRYSSLVE